MDKLPKVITIDGPSGVGKGTISRLLAKALGWNWLDSGALYRLTAYAAQQQGVALDDVSGLVEVAKNLNVHFSLDTESADPDIQLDGVVVNSYIRNEACGAMASKVGAFGEVRAALTDRQRAFLTAQGLVADGRDMGTIIFPEAPVKVFLTASAEERARRRERQLKAQGLDVNMSHLLREIIARDERDRMRAVAPLVPATDALVIDTSVLSINEVLDKVLAEVNKVFHPVKEGLPK